MYYIWITENDRSPDEICSLEEIRWFKAQITDLQQVLPVVLRLIFHICSLIKSQAIPIA